MAFNYLGTVKKYIQKQSVCAPWKEGLLLCGPGSDRGGRFGSAIVIPAMHELQELPATLQSLCANPVSRLEETLVVVVVNNSPDSLEETRENNRLTSDYLRNLDSPLNILVVDAFSRGREIPRSQGVGLARRIGMDLALEYLDFREDKAPLIICLDADTRVESNYLEALEKEFSSYLTAKGVRFRGGGGVISYAHRIPGDKPEEAWAIMGYELYLRHYVAGLRQAGSPYDYHSIGSTMLCTADAYCAVGGMPRRAACEDFYFLLKLAKLGPIRKVTETVVRPSSRGEIRAPIGTGCHVCAVMEKGDAFQGGYNPDSFRLLEGFLNLCSNSWGNTGAKVYGQSSAMNPELGEFLASQDFVGAWDRIAANSPDPLDMSYPFMVWFDGFRTMRLLNFLKEKGYPDLRIEEAAARQLEASGLPSDHPVPNQRAELLELMRRLYP